MNRLIVDQSDWAQLRLTGPDRVRFLHGMCSANIETLAVGGWARAVVLTPKGRVVSIIEVVKREDELVIVCEPTLGAPTLALLERHAIMDEIELALGAGPLHRVWDEPSSVWDAAPRFEAPPTPTADPGSVEIRRIEAGLPAYGVDVDDSYFPFESLLAGCLDYDKGCYVGQEPIYRVHAKGAPQRIMRGLRAVGPGSVAPGTVVVHAERENAGTVTSSAESPEFGSIALATLHRTAAAPGSAVTVDGRDAVVVELPFAASPGAVGG